MRILAYSDIHFCHSFQLVTLEDIAMVHNRVTEQAAILKPQIVLFLGDRFRARQPKDHVRAVAETELRKLAAVQASHNGYVALLVGNHDRYSESVGSGNTFSTVRIFGDVLDNVVVMAEPKSYAFVAHSTVIHALPAGFGIGAATHQPVPDAFNIFAFHGLVKGAVFDQDEKVEIDRGISKEAIDLPEWDIVLGGDVHRGQRFDFHNTQGGYVGATLRFNEDEAGLKRGYMIVDLEKGQEPQFELVEAGGPEFMKVSIDVDAGAWPEPNFFEDVVGIITLVGSSVNVNNVTDGSLREKYASARDIRVHRRPRHEASHIIEGIKATSSPLDDVVAYIHVSDTEDLDPGRLTMKAAEALNMPPPERKGMFG